MSGPHRNPDRLNTIGVVVIGVCGAVLVYVTIVALQAFYVSDTSEIQTMADYGGQDIQARNVRVSQTKNLNAPSTPNPAGAVQTYRIPLKHAFKRVVEAVKTDPKNVGNLVPALGPSNVPTVAPAFGRPKPLTPPAAPARSAAPPADSGSGSGSASKPIESTPTRAAEPATTPPQTGSAAKGNAG